MAKRTRLGREIEAALADALAHARGRLALETRIVKPDPKAILAIRKRAARSRTKFAALYGVPEATLREWESGRRSPDLAARAYLAVIGRDPVAVARLYAEGRELS